MGKQTPEDQSVATALPAGESGRRKRAGAACAQWGRLQRVRRPRVPSVAAVTTRVSAPSAEGASSALLSVLGPLRVLSESAGTEWGLSSPVARGRPSAPLCRVTPSGPADLDKARKWLVSPELAARLSLTVQRSAQPPDM